ncbi:type II toxin-antitoxin system PemK/MazF family toxin [Nonomuraea sp. K274]|uniref:mRNA interferase n=1 Tax=Nonomuraea cypriaca TaxID=1187855 RepID=A0A931AF63_9ACTN|nr:type II toxin-antitoxin system PemK/MazF family toxin [Nonomuraea cypriaca]MBF8190485.1 type II toxin-antitoxin system PemK/MazF family toxin [Nonomuraea cypriaca]
MRVIQGEIWLADLGEPTGREQGYRRPVLIVSNDDFNSAAPVKIVVPLTTTQRGWDNHIPIPTEGTGLEKPSWAMVEHVRSVSPRRFTRRIGIAHDELVREVTDWITDMI